MAFRSRILWLGAMVLLGVWQPVLAVGPKRVAMPEIVAHRGASHDAPENTLASVNLAWKRKAPSVEIDVYLSRDKRVVVYHDKTTKRIGGRDREVKDQTLEELRQLDVGSWKSPKYKGEQVPTLEEVLVPAYMYHRYQVESTVTAVVPPLATE